MAKEPTITAEMLQAVQILRADTDVQITEDLHPTPDGELELRCTVPVTPQPNPEKLPARARLRVRLDPAFPYHEVDVYTEDPEIASFPHQDAETNKLCLLQKRDAPLDVRRLKIYIDWTREWLSDAATGNLLKNGDPYELPDFSRRDFRKRIPTDLVVLFDESPKSLSKWANQVGEYGRVELTPGETTNGLLVKSFRDSSGKLLREWTYTASIVNPANRVFGHWILLPSLTYFRNRPPQIFGELIELCRKAGIDLLSVIKAAWRERNRKPETAFIMVGCPIPRVVGGPPNEIHWQPLFFQGQATVHRELKRDDRYGNFTKRKAFNLLINQRVFDVNSPLPWGKSENISVERLYARGGHKSFFEKRIVLAGCGALGSIIAEMLARGGASDVVLVDGDLMEMGNQCRHTLDGRNLRKGKAISLASRLQSSNPLSKIEGYGVKLPLGAGDKETKEKVSKALDDANIIVDCTTDEDAFQWLNQVSKKNRARMVSIFINFDASMLTLCISGRTTTCRRVCRRLYTDVGEGKTPVSPDAFMGTSKSEDLIMPGAGCWSPTFPGSNAHIWSLAAVAVDALNQLLTKPLKTDGTGIIFLRNTGGVAENAPPIQTVWMKEYR